MASALRSGALRTEPLVVQISTASSLIPRFAILIAVTTRSPPALRRCAWGFSQFRRSMPRRSRCHDLALVEQRYDEQQLR